MIRCPELPLLPGNGFNRNVGQTRFHKSHHLDVGCGGQIAYISDSVRPGVGGAPLPLSDASRYPSIYARGEVSDLPTWIAFNKQCLSFDAYFQETVQEKEGYNHTVRKCKIYFYLEDGTIKVVEPKIPNSGIPQGCLMARQRIRFPPSSRSNDFYDIIDLNVGKQVEFFGRVFMITNCDPFTRNFLNRLGISIPDPINTPPDPYIVNREKAKLDQQAKKPNTRTDKLGQFLALDGQLLCFTGIWDDQATEYGRLHRIELKYYLADDTIEVKDVTRSDERSLLLRRARLSKELKGLPMPGSGEPYTILNVLGGPGKTRRVLDQLDCGRTGEPNYYMDRDLALGAVINVYGRRIVLTDCDPFTREYYRTKYGLDDFTPVPQPPTEEELEKACVPQERELPPFNGIGTHEDSAINCRTVLPISPVKSYKQFLALDKHGLDSHILRFSAQLITKVPSDSLRTFIISYFLSDDTINVFETCEENSGFNGGYMIARRPIMKPGQNIFTSRPPAMFSKNDFYVGNTLCLENFKLVLTGADEYALRYMELHSREFPVSNTRLIMEKLRTAIRPIYKDFVAKLITEKMLPCVPMKYFRDSLKAVLGDNVNEHELLTLARCYLATETSETISSCAIRSLTHDELKRDLWNAFDRLEEAFRQRDMGRTGRVTRDAAYCVLRGAKLPLDVHLVNAILDKTCKNEAGDITYADLLEFLNYKKSPTHPAQPISLMGAMSWMTLSRPSANATVQFVNIEKLISDLDLEKDITAQT